MGGVAAIQVYEWTPNGTSAGPQVHIQVKLDVTGHFDVQCGKQWVFAYFGGGEHDPITQSSSGLISGTETYPSNSVGVGSSYRTAEVDGYDVKSGGPLVMTLDAQASPFPAKVPAAATGTLDLTLYAPGSRVPAAKAVATKHRKHRHRTKAKHKASVIATCQIPFSAANYYAEA